MAAVSSVNLVIHRGADFEEEFTLLEDTGLGLNLTGYSAVCKLRKHPTAETAYSFGTTLTVADSSVKISMGSSITESLPKGRCYYDLFVISQNGFKSKVFEGNVLIQESSSI